MATSLDESSRSVIDSTLRDKCGVCGACIALLFRPSATSQSSDHQHSQQQQSDGEANASKETQPCKICLGIITDCAAVAASLSVSSSSSSSSSSSLVSGEPNHRRLQNEISSAAGPYGGIASNPIAKESPTVSIPAVVMVRAYAAIGAVHIALNEASDTASSSSKLIRTHIEYYDAAKEYVRGRAREEVARMQRQKKEKEVITEQQQPPPPPPPLPYPYSHVTPEMEREEAGYLGVHLLFVPHSPCGDDGDDDCLLPPDTILKIGNYRRGDRKRFRGNDPTKKQGGDPKVNLLKRVTNKSMGGSNGAWNMERNDVQRVLDQVDRSGTGGESIKKALAEWIVGLSSSSEKKTEGGECTGKQYFAHAAVWRKPFYIGGKYTKARRDVSQSPFYVPDGPGASMVKKGVTSVEEEICSVLSKIGCCGISNQNNETRANEDDNDAKGRSSGRAGAVVYGMCKFHASGREDLDVRMLLPFVDSSTNSTRQGEEKVGGRPFVCEVIDAYRLPTPVDLIKVINAINSAGEHHLDVSDIIVDAGVVSPNNPAPAENSRRKRRYGCNPNGVDVAHISYCPSSSFKGLQGETENKVKYYGCAVWCERLISSQKELDELLGVICKGDNTSTRSRYPVEIHQSTPLRVLHRRAAAIRNRHVLTLTARRVNDHWFALHLSTSAGTYVKEFVHGDCGRTKPSISSMLGCKTDIVRLDCEGITM